MIEHTYHVLEFHKLLHILSGYASCPLGQSNCLSLKPLKDLKDIDNEQRLVSEMKLLLQLKGFFSFQGLIDIGPILKNCRAEGSFLETEGLLSILKITDAGKQSKKLILSHKSLYPGLYNLIKDMPLCENLGEAIKKAISPTGDINDSASGELKKIRRKRRELRRELQKKLENIKKSKGLTSNGDDHLISIRDGRYVIPLRTDMKSRVEGIIHDYSHTQATCFFEPLEVIQDNNRLSELSHLEKEEEIRILISLTAMAKHSAGDLLTTRTLLGKLDGLYARALFSNALKGIRPVMIQENIVDLKQAKNPILLSIGSENDGPVPVDIFLDKDVNVMIISGPNRGGKTVTLKTLGLLSLMAQTGLHIPAAEGSCLPVFKTIIAEIGDDQDIQAGLSTFSAHVSHLKYMMEHADQESLIIIDEPGMGTDPNEGAALAMAVLDDLSRKGAMVTVSTHYNRLKTYGLLNDRARNACVELDASTNRPTFSLRYGTPGTSYAFETAHDAGIKPDILDRAKRFLDQDEVRLNQLIDKLNRLKNETAFEKSEAEHIKEKYHLAKEKLLQASMKLDSDKKTLLEKKKNEAEQLIKRAREEFKTIINSFKEKKDTSPAHVKQQYDQIKKTLTENLRIEGKKGESVELKGLKIGQAVRHRRLQKEGMVLSFDPLHSKALIMAGNVKLSVNLRDLEVVADDVNIAEQHELSWDHSSLISGSPAKEINLIGCRVAEALPMIDKIIDRAMVEGELSLKIIHGHGTGSLKKSIREHLKCFSCVKKICGADPQSGGDAITIVELR